MTTERVATRDASGLPRRCGRLLLRRLSSADLDRFAAVRADPELGRYQGWTAMSPEAAWIFLTEMHSAPAWQLDVWFQLAIADAASDQLLGDLGVCVHADGHAEIGVTLARDAHRQGHATAAIGCLIALLFERPQIERVVGITDARNGPSARLLQRAGLRQTQTLQTTFRGEACTEWTFERRRPPPASV